MSKIYFGGSRHPQNINPALVGSVVAAVVAAGHSVQVGCQFGADQAVVENCPPSSLVVFAVAPVLSSCPWHIRVACGLGAGVRVAAGGTNAPIKARYLLRSIAAFQGCSVAVFFSPGAGSLAVARECVKSGLPVFAFGHCPAPVPSQAGEWWLKSFAGFQAWQWQTPTQPTLF